MPWNDWVEFRDTFGRNCILVSTFEAHSFGPGYERVPGVFARSALRDAFSDVLGRSRLRSLLGTFGTSLWQTDQEMLERLLAEVEDSCTGRFVLLRELRRQQVQGKAEVPSPKVVKDPSQGLGEIKPARRAYFGRIVGPNGPLGNWPFLLQRDGRPLSRGAMSGTSRNVYQHDAWMSGQHGDFRFDELPEAEYSIKVLLPLASLIVNAEAYPRILTESGARSATPGSWFQG